MINFHSSKSTLILASLLCSLGGIQNISAADCFKCNTEDNSASSETSESTETSGEEVIPLPRATSKEANKPNPIKNSTPSQEEFTPLPMAVVKKPNPSIFDIKENPKYPSKSQITPSSQALKQSEKPNSTPSMQVTKPKPQVLETEKPSRISVEQSKDVPLPVKFAPSKLVITPLEEDAYKKLPSKKLIEKGNSGDEKAQKIYLDTLMDKTQREVRKNSKNIKPNNNNNNNSGDDSPTILDEIRHKFLKKIAKLCDDKKWSQALQMRKELMEEKSQKNNHLIGSKPTNNNSNSRRLTESTFSETTGSESTDSESTTSSISSTSSTSSTSSGGNSYKNHTEAQLIKLGDEGDRKAQKTYLKTLKKESREESETNYLKDFDAKKSDRKNNFHKIYLEKLFPYCDKGWREAKKEEKMIKEKSLPAKKTKIHYTNLQNEGK